VSLGHHRSLVYWIPTAAVMASTFRHQDEALDRYKAFAGEGIFRFSVGIEDAEDICADLDQVLT
jgi:methionine-gamma-lyase